MKTVKVTRPLYIRKGPGTSYESIGVVYPSGKDLVFDGKKEDGQYHKGLSGWYYKKNDKGELQWLWEGGTRESTYDDKLKDFLNDSSMAHLHNNSSDEANWKVSWAHVDLEIWKIWSMNFKGKDVRVAVLDSGINRNIIDITNAIQDVDLDVKCFVPDEAIDDDRGHGTECASIIASRGLNFFGVSPECSLIIGKIESNKFGKTSKVTLSALQWACEERNADIISLSFSFPSKSEEPPTEDEKAIAAYMLKMHREKNKLFVASIGNLGEKAKDRFSYPANYQGCISIAGHDRDRNIWIGSSWNKNIAFSIPCVDLKGYVKNGQTEVLHAATSYACPFAVGVLANLISWYKSNNKSFIATEFVKKLQFDTPSENAPLKFGHGIINIIKSLNNFS